MTTPNTSGNEGQHSGGGFTPGPWKAGGRYVGTPNHASFIAECRDQNGNWTNEPMAVRNARLISTAPDGYRLAELMVAFHDAVFPRGRPLCIDGQPIDHKGLNAACQLAREIISKALGTAPGSVGEGDVSAQSQPLADAGPNSPRSPDNHSFDGKEGA